MEKRFHPMLLAISIACLSNPALAQSPGPTLLKGRVKAGLYEQKTQSEVSGIPGVPPGQEKHVESRQRCISQAESDKGIELAPGCTLKSQVVSGNIAQFISECRDGAVHDMKITTTATGFTSDMKSEGKGRDGAPFALTMHSESRYIGPCKD
jgi:hypothetical protein